MAIKFIAKLIALNSRYTHSSLSLFYLRHELNEHLPEADIEIYQYTINDPYYDTLTQITDNAPDFLFFSAYIWNSTTIFRLAADINRIMPQIKIIIGGPQVSFLPDSRVPAHCSIVHGEIEGIDPSFYQDLKNNTCSPVYDAVSNPTFSFPYRQADFRNHLQNRHLYYESSRGCPYSCSYCLSASQHPLRLKDIVTVKEELAIILAHNPQTLRFVDRTFNISEERSLAIWHFLAENAKATCCHFEISPDRFSEKMFDFLETIPTGRFQFEIGLQSTNPATLSAIQRTTDMKQALANIARLTQLNTIHLHVDLILGLPYETVETFQKSFNDTFTLFPHYIQMGLLKILPGTPISHQIDEFSIKSCIQPPYEILANHWLDHQSLKRLYRFGECVEAFYNNRFFKTFFLFIKKNRDDYFLFFDHLLTRCIEVKFFNEAKTQKLMSSLLCEMIANEPGKKILRELLIFDWIHSGHRFLPNHLKNAQLNQEKEHLWKNMPQNLPDLYTYRTRNHFFRKTLFMRFSKETLETVGLSRGQDGVVCFMAEKGKNIMGYCKTFFIADKECNTAERK